MQTTVPPQHATVEFDVALRYAASLARMRYIGEAERIDRGLVLALNGHVHLQDGGPTLVQSSSDPEVFYHVQGHTCDCPDFARAPEGRCKHRFCVCLVRKAQVLGATAPMYERWYAIYTTPTGEEWHGVATQTTRGWLFVPEQGASPRYASAHALCRLGLVAVADTQQAIDLAALAQAWTTHLLHAGCTVTQA